jgi:hypothetical protein
MSAFGTGVVNIADLRELARRRLPRMVFDYLDGGAETSFCAPARPCSCRP